MENNNFKVFLFVIGAIVAMVFLFMGFDKFFNSQEKKALTICSEFGCVDTDAVLWTSNGCVTDQKAENVFCGTYRLKVNQGSVKVSQPQPQATSTSQ